MYFTSQLLTYFSTFIEAQPVTIQKYSRKCRLKNRNNFHHKIFVRAQIGADWHSRDGCAKEKHYATKHGRVPG